MILPMLIKKQKFKLSMYNGIKHYVKVVECRGMGKDCLILVLKETYVFVFYNKSK